MILTKDTRIVLDAINSMEPDLQGRFYTNEAIYLKVRSKRIQYREDVYAILCSAETLGLVQFADSQRTYVRRLELGRNYRQLRRKELVAWLCNSVFVPIAVAIVTAFLTSLSVPSIAHPVQELLEKFRSVLQLWRQ